MAYKFNVGTFNLKGTLNASGGDIDLPANSVDNADLTDNAVDTAEIAANAVETAKILDLNVTAGKLAANSVETAKILDLNVTAGKLAANAVETAKIKDLNVTRGKIALDAVDGTLIADNAVDSEHIALGALDAEHYGTGSIESNHLAGAIANAKLASSAITIGGTSVSLGGSIAASVLATAIDSEDMAITGLTDLDVKSAGNITILDTVGANTLTVGAAGTTVSIAGNLTVLGTTTTINSTDLSVDDRIIRIGDGLADLAAGVTATAGFEIGNNLASIKLNTNVNGSGLDGFESSLPFKATSFHGNGAGLSGITADAASSLQHSMFNITASNTVSEPKMVICNLQPSTAGVLTISGSFNPGDQILVKAGVNVDTTATLTVTGAAGYGYNFDGAQTAVLESPRAGFTLVYDGDAPNALWHIM